MAYKITLYSELEITTCIGKNQEAAIIKLKEMLYDYEILSINLETKEIQIKNEEYGVQKLTYLVDENALENDLEHIDDPLYVEQEIN